MGHRWNMKLRWLQTYDENGVNSEWILQYNNHPWDKEFSEWEDVEYIREREKEE
jgi:hypothetical protein